MGRKTREAVLDGDGKNIIKAGVIITPKFAKELAGLSRRKIKVLPFVSDDVVYLPADSEDHCTIAQANAKLDQNNQFVDEKVEARLGDRYLLEVPGKIELMDVSPKQIFSASASLIPFLEHNDANRALMGSNMQRQAVPLICPEAPLVATGMEVEVAKYSGQVLFAENAGVVTEVAGLLDDKDGDKYRVVVTRGDGEKDIYKLMKFVRTNQGTCINQRPTVSKGDRVEAGQLLADSSATEKGELALWQNVVFAFMR